MIKQAKPFGTWNSPISAEMVAQKGVRYGHCQVYNNAFYWLETRPSEKGRGVICCYENGKIKDISPQDLSVRTKVHEMGGGDFYVNKQGLFFVDASSQNLMRLHQNTLTTLLENNEEHHIRCADFCFDNKNNRLIAVAEQHSNREVKNFIISIEIESGHWHSITEGADFYAAPRLSPDGQSLAWLQWNFPNMPWDGTELWRADYSNDGQLSNASVIYGGKTESVLQPKWRNDNVLFFISDRSGFWNLYSHQDDVLNAILPIDSDCVVPPWSLGNVSYCFAINDNIYLTRFHQGQQELLHINTDSGHCESVDLPFNEYPGQLHTFNDKLVALASGPTISQSFWQINPENAFYQSIINPMDQIEIPLDYVTIAKPIEFSSAQGYKSYGFFYEPLNPQFCGEPNERPPLIVMSHGGPTGYCDAGLNLAIQFWTSRGFAVVDVNYSGSTGFGREYRNSLNGHWGINDVNDCVYAARFLVERGWVDHQRLLIRGGSAGGFTTLCALTFFDDFAAGMSRYGVADLIALTEETHKFEARYLDQLVGPYPEMKTEYEQRSPINNTDRLSCPILILQGSEDKVVPPSQSQALVAALKAKDIPYEYVEFEGEGHGFRQEANIIKSLHLEYGFYLKVLGI